MSADKQRFVLYEYLLYFWKKKILFLIVPPIVALATFLGVHFILDHAKYTGKAVVFTGSISRSDLTNPDNIMAKFPNVKNQLDIVVTEDKYVKITVKGNDEKSVQKDLHYIVTHYNEELKKHSKERLDVTMETLNDYETQMKRLNTLAQNYDDKFDTQSLGIDQITSKAELLQTLADVTEKVNKIKGDLIFYEEPSVLSEAVAPSKTYAKEAIASGLVLGVFLTFMLLTLMKYLFEARRYYQ
ncbi:hypothetical protein [Anoxybacteroides tepidamans]|uniref:hypothetical protein n=1 Tax=Anoxybacteroides tepidamans TaxID=265948 RepID=UPI00048241B7|nr:hypothetical protein [Anoxybacillus tepidamans]